MADTALTIPATNTSPTAPVKTPSAVPSSAGRSGRAYKRFLELPVALVLGVMWLAGVALIGSCALVVYLVVSALI